MQSFDFQPRTRVIFGEGAVARLGEAARELNFRRTLLVADHGLVAAGHVGRAFAAGAGVDSIVGLGGGSSLDCAKGINFLLTNGGRMRDYLGYGRAARPLLPMIGVPTTSGTGSEAQSYALISDAVTHAKMACGDATAAFRVA